jgi:general secretion pathway protein B
VRTERTRLPTRDEVRSPDVASLPELRLDLLVYDANPAKRFVMINMRRLREGDSLDGGVRVDRITEEGAELDFRGTRFLLPHE